MQKILSLKQGMQKTLFFAFFLLCSTVMMAQQKVSGSVLDATGEPLIGVSVLEVGTTNGVVTDFDGNFTLTVKSGAQLAFSYIGYVPQTLAAANGMKVTLEEEPHRQQKQTKDHTKYFFHRSTPYNSVIHLYHDRFHSARIFLRYCPV